MDKISELLGAQQGIADAPTVEATAKTFDTISDNLKKNVKKLASEDYQFAREQLKEAISKCASMMPGLVALANVAESPLLYNSAASFFKVFSDMNSSLIDASTKMDKIAQNTPKQEQSKEKEEPPKISLESTPQGGVAFEGTTADLLNQVLEEMKVQRQQGILIDQQ